jgi:DNA-binding ferritin-like protein
MNRLLGYTLLSLGLVGFVFFLNYKGTAIPVKELWFVLSLFVMGAGAYFVTRHKLKLEVSEQYETIQDNLADRLRATGELVKVTLDNSEVKARTFQQEATTSAFPSRMEMLDSLGGRTTNIITEIQQTYIVLYRTYGDRTYKFTSRAMAQDTLTIKRYMETNGSINLYVDRTNPTQYFFDLPFL